MVGLVIQRCTIHACRAVGWLQLLCRCDALAGAKFPSSAGLVAKNI